MRDRTLTRVSHPVRLIWTEEQLKWLRDHLGILDGYARMTSLAPQQKQFRHEIQMLQLVQQAVAQGSTRLPAVVEIWRDWAYWYSACWLATKFSPAPQHIQQFEDSMAFRLMILVQREAQLSALKLKHPTP